MPEEIKHHEFSPSRLNQFAICPGAYRMQLGLTETKSPDAEEGTMLHAKVASKDIDGLNAEQAAAVQFCLDYLEKLMRDREAETGRKVVRLLFEEKVEIEDEDGNLLTSGIADVVVVYDDQTGDVIDWKFGRGEVTAVKENYQTAAYSVGVAQRYNLIAVTAHIVQPRIYKTDSFTFRYLHTVMSAVRHVINEAASTGKLILNPTENGCKYCLAKSICPAFAARFSAIAKIEKRDLSNPDVLLDYWEKSQVVEKFIADVKKAVTEYVAEHGRLGNWVLTERAGKREIRDTAALYDRVSGLLTSQELAECYTVSVTAILDKLASGAVTRAAATGVKLSMKKAREDAEALLGELIVKGKPSQTLTRRPEK